GELIIKRVIAIEGDTFEIGEDGVIRITYTDEIGNKVNKAIKETYVNNGESTVITKTTVKQGEVYLLGDNRAVSYDSRTFGAVSVKGIVGKIILGVD
ncbi:MAG: signal peptidase I, partial [Clostridia bacterium]|nr:signal peptidase I [Clostridia bacterium]